MAHRQVPARTVNLPSVCIGGLILLGAALVMGGLVSLASAGYYETRFEDPWTGCSYNQGVATWPNRSEADCDRESGSLFLVTEINSYPGSTWAEAEVWRDFTYMHRHAYLNKFEFEFDIGGEMDTTRNGGNGFYLIAELWRGTTCLQSDTIYSIVNADSVVPGHTETYSGLCHCLHPWYQYQVRLRAKAYCTYDSLGDFAHVNFWYEDSNGIDWRSLTVSHVHGGTYEADGVDPKKKQASEEYKIAQKEYADPGADGFSFGSINTEHDIDGYYIEISDFYNSTSQYSGDRRVNVTADGWHICKTCTVTVFARHYLDDEGCPNEMGLRDAVWSQSDGGSRILQPGQVKIMPDWDWDVHPPVRIAEYPDSFCHTFKMVNSDVSDTLRITELRFRATDILYDSLSTVPFPPGPSFSFALAPGDSFIYGVNTLGTFAENHIYFNYGVSGVSDSTDSCVVCNAWGHHVVYFDSLTAGTPHSEGPEGITIPQVFRLHQNLPNPFGEATEIRYDLPVRCDVSLTVYNVMGEKVRVIVDTAQSPGYKTALWDGRDNEGRQVPAGIYFYRFTAGDYVGIKKLALLK
jgi:hypothetical protein